MEAGPMTLHELYLRELQFHRVLLQQRENLIIDDLHQQHSANDQVYIELIKVLQRAESQDHEHLAFLRAARRVLHVWAKCDVELNGARSHDLAEHAFSINQAIDLKNDLHSKMGDVLRNALYAYKDSAKINSSEVFANVHEALFVACLYAFARYRPKIRLREGQAVDPLRYRSSSPEPARFDPTARLETPIVVVHKGRVVGHLEADDPEREEALAEARDDNDKPKSGRGHQTFISDGASDSTLSPVPDGDDDVFERDAVLSQEAVDTNGEDDDYEPDQPQVLRSSKSDRVSRAAESDEEDEDYEPDRPRVTRRRKSARVSHANESDDKDNKSGKSGSDETGKSKSVRIRSKHAVPMRGISIGELYIRWTEEEMDYGTVQMLLDPTVVSRELANRLNEYFAGREVEGAGGRMVVRPPRTASAIRQRFTQEYMQHVHERLNADYSAIDAQYPPAQRERIDWAAFRNELANRSNNPASATVDADGDDEMQDDVGESEGAEMADIDEVDEEMVEAAEILLSLSQQ